MEACLSADRSEVGCKRSEVGDWKVEVCLSPAYRLPIQQVGMTKKEKRPVISPFFYLPTPDLSADRQASYL